MAHLPTKEKYHSYPFLCVMFAHMHARTSYAGNKPLVIGEDSPSLAATGSIIAFLEQLHSTSLGLGQAHGHHQLSHLCWTPPMRLIPDLKPESCKGPEQVSTQTLPAISGLFNPALSAKLVRAQELKGKNQGETMTSGMKHMRLWAQLSGIVLKWCEALGSIQAPTQYKKKNVVPHAHYMP